MKRTSSRRGVTLALVLMVMSLVGGLIVLLAWHSANLHRQRQFDRARLVSEHLLASAADYARVHRKDWAASQPTQPVELNVKDLVPPPLVGVVTLSFSPVPGKTTCHIVAAIEGTTYNTRRELDVPLESASSLQNSQPATQP